MSNMSEWEQTEEELTAFTHELFLSNRYSNWRKQLATLDLGVWYPLYDNLKDNDMPLDEIRMFGDKLIGQLVFDLARAPDFSESNQLLIRFMVSGSMWDSLVWHDPTAN
ncbi:MAG: hypothetical protein AB8B84_16220 [Granulosicoccus sp.]